MGLPHLRRALALTIMMTVATLSSTAPAADDASVLITGLRDQVRQMLTDERLTTADRIERFRTIMSERFDLPKIARIVLGRYWQTASETEQKEFTSVFEDYVARTYTTGIGDLRGDAFQIIGQNAENGTTTLVHTRVIQLSTGFPLRVDWRIMQTPEGAKITDVSVEGVSMVMAQREEFASVMQQNGGKVSNLVRELRAKMTELATRQQ